MRRSGIALRITAYSLEEPLQKKLARRQICVLQTNSTQPRTSRISGPLSGQLMSKEGTYRDPDLSITRLAAMTGVTEKKLRVVINERLGHKNFPSYVNAFRLEEVRQRLVDPRQDHLPILTLALEAGFGSIVAFNRAFNDKYGTTPSAYRAEARSGKPEENAERVGKPT